MKDKENTWRDNLLVDEPVLIDNNRENILSVGKVERLTKTQIILADGRKFRKSDGYLIGCSTWNITYLIQTTKERLNEIMEYRKRRVLIAEIGCVQWNDLSTEKLTEIIKTVKEK